MEATVLSVLTQTVSLATLLLPFYNVFLAISLSLMEAVLPVPLSIQSVFSATLQNV